MTQVGQRALRALRSGLRLLCAAVPMAVAPVIATAGLTAGDPIPDRYVVVFDDAAVLDEAGGGDVEAVARGLLTKVGGGTLLATYAHALSGFAARMSAQQAALLETLAPVAYVEQDRWVEATGAQTYPNWGLDRIDQRDLPLDYVYRYPNQGGGVHLYVLDTGLRATHSEFGRRVGDGRNYAPNDDGVIGGLLPGGIVPLNLGSFDGGLGLFAGDTDPYDTTDCNGHGTHVAGIAAGARYGVAKSATVHPVRVLGCNGGGAVSDVISGINWVAAYRRLPAVANMSLSTAISSALDQAVQNAINTGVTFVVAAGNALSDACNSSPARVPAAITVAASKRTDARDTSYSNYGSCVDLFAPGTDIRSAWNTGDSASNTLSGTSMAAPHVAGAAALILAERSGATPSRVSAELLGNATRNRLSNIGTGSPNALLYVGN